MSDTWRGTLDILKTRWILNYDTYTHHYRDTVSEEQCSHWDIDTTEHTTESSQKTKPFISVCLSIPLSWIHILGIPGGKQNNSLCKEITNRGQQKRQASKQRKVCLRKVRANNMFIYFVYLYVYEGSHVPWYYIQQSKTSWRSWSSPSIMWVLGI